MRKFLTFLLALVASAFFPATLWAADFGQTDAPPDGDLTVYKDTHVTADQVINGDLVAYMGNLTIDGTVNGDLTAFGGDVILNGSVTGDIAVMGGDLSIVDGDFGGRCAILGGKAQGEGASELCDYTYVGIFEGNPLNALTLSPQQEMPSPADPGIDMEDPASRRIGFFAGALGMILTSLFAGFAAYLIAAAFPLRLQHAKEVVASKTMTSGAVGLLTAVASTSFLALTSPIWLIILFFLSFIFGLGIILALGALFFLLAVIIYGWTTVGSLVGNRFAGNRFADGHHIGKNEPTITAIGSAVITLFTLFLTGLVPWLGLLLGFAILATGLGGVVLTRLGRQHFPPRPAELEDVIISPAKVESVLDTLPRE